MLNRSSSMRASHAAALEIKMRGWHPARQGEGHCDRAGLCQGLLASFDGERITSDAGALLLGATDRMIGLTRRFAIWFQDKRNPAFVEHSVEGTVRLATCRGGPGRIAEPAKAPFVQRHFG
jgi:hypothetical protein